MIRSILWFLLFIVISSRIFSQIPSGYYDAAAGKSGDALRTTLRDITTATHVKLPYTSTAFDVWDAYSYTDVRPAPNNTVIWDMYSDIPSSAPVYTFTVISDQCGTASAEGDCYSREHLVPNSWWGGLDNASNPQYTDLHHLFPADQFVNSKKGNYIVAKVGTVSWTSTNGSKLGSCGWPGYTGMVFEPIDEYKGDFARAFFYMVTRYMDAFGSWVAGYPGYDSQYIFNTSANNYYQWYIDLLISWHLADPVSQKETDRNNAIYYNTPQNNRNPYIDHPEYVCLVWTSSYCSSGPVITNVVNSPLSPAAGNSVTVSADITDDGSVSWAKLVWCINGSSFADTIVMNPATGTQYITATSIAGQAVGTTVYYKILARDNSGQQAISAIYTYTIPMATACAADLFFSEYCEGSSNNKYVEIYNGTGNSVGLSDYRLRLFANGAVTPTQDIVLSGTLSNQGVIVYKNSSATVYTGTSTVNNAMAFNGDDAVALFKISTSSYVDIIGRIGEDPGTAWTSGSHTTLDATLVRNASVTGGVTSNPASGFPTLATQWVKYATDNVAHLGSHSSSCSSLPVVLNYFEVSCQNEFTVIGWETASEENCSYFTVERSFGDENWIKVGIVAGSGNSNSYRSYSVNDTRMEGAIYRLSETDTDGSIQYLGMKTASCKNDAPGYLIFPNPGNGIMNITTHGKKGSYMLLISDMTGKMIRQIAFDAQEGTATSTINTEMNEPGLYRVQLIPGNGEDIRTFLYVTEP